MLFHWMIVGHKATTMRQAGHQNTLVYMIIAMIIEQYPTTTAIFSPCGCHTRNLCGNDAADCIPEAVTYLGTIQTIYTLFSCKPKRREILAKRIGCSLHGISVTRWSDRVESVEPFVTHLPGVKLAMENLLELNLTSKTRNKIHRAICYVMLFFTCQLYGT